MATKTIRIDDFDGKSEDAEPVFFSLNDVFYRLDLAEPNRKKLLDVLQPFIDKAERTEAPKGGKRTPASEYLNGFGEVDPQVIREWAKSQGIPVNDKGRVPEEVVSRYKTAHANAGKQPQLTE